MVGESVETIFNQIFKAFVLKFIFDNICVRSFWGLESNAWVKTLKVKGAYNKICLSRI